MSTTLLSIEEQIADISRDIGGILEWQKEHAAQDDQRFEAIGAQIKALPTSEDMKKLATREDVAEVLRVFNAVSTAVKITSRGGKVGYTILTSIATMVVAWSVLSGAWRHALASILTIVGK